MQYNNNTLCDGFQQKTGESKHINQQEVEKTLQISSLENTR